MLGSKITNQDEEEVEEELAALEAEVGVVSLPSVPVTEPPPKVRTSEEAILQADESEQGQPTKRPEREAILAS